MSSCPSRSPGRRGVRRFFGVLLAPCREHGRLMSLELDGQASRAERWGLRAHYLVCAPCRRLARDFRRIADTIRRAGADAPREHAESMPADVRDRIEASLRR